MSKHQEFCCGCVYDEEPYEQCENCEVDSRSYKNIPTKYMDSTAKAIKNIIDKLQEAKWK